jgi:anti-anti-sigma factor
VEITRDESGCVLRILGALDISVAEQLRKELWNSLDGNPSLIVDLASVDACDVAAIQLLYSARKAADNCSKSLIFKDLSAAIESTMDMLGLSLNELTAQYIADNQEHRADAARRSESTIDGV